VYILPKANVGKINDHQGTNGRITRSMTIIIKMSAQIEFNM